MLSIKDLNESLNRKYSLTEKVNHENDEVNAVIRRNVGKKLRDISPEDRELLANNGISVSGGKDYRTYSANNDNRSMTLDKNGRTKEYSTYGPGKPSQPDVNNPDFDLKGWLSTDAKRLYGAQYKPSNEYKRLKSYADDAENRGRRYRKDLEAQVQNSMLDNDDYYPRVDYESRDRAIRGNYEWADRLNDRAKKVASDAKARSKYYKNESLTEARNHNLYIKLDEDLNLNKKDFIDNLSSLDRQIEFIENKFNKNGVDLEDYVKSIKLDLGYNNDLVLVFKFYDDVNIPKVEAKVFQQTKNSPYIIDTYDVFEILCDRLKLPFNESLNESVVTTNPAKYSELIDAIGDIQNWIDDYVIDLQDVLYDVFNHSPESKFEDFIINLRNEYRDEE